MRWMLAGLACAQALLGADGFVGAMGGVATLSADARTEGSPPVRFSAYKPENGPTVLLFAGRHFSDFLSAQAGYSWNRNSVVLSQADVAGNSYELPLRAHLHTFGVDAMAYFRPKASRVRPYLAAGPTLSYIRADASGPAQARGVGPATTQKIRSTRLGLRVAVGIDWQVTERVALRYSFSETIQGNPFSRALDPRGQRNLANFQNWWGAVWTF